MSNDTEDFLNASISKQVAILTLRLQSEREIAHQLELKRGDVQRIKKSEEFARALKELAEEKTSELLYRWKKNLEALYSDAWEAFRFNLKDKKNMEAVKEYLHMLGWNAKEAGDGDTPAINIIMPSNEPPQTVIEVKTDDNSSGA